jgi:DNA invertase Pin-like site-specific DNA recombinase
MDKRTRNTGTRIRTACLYARVSLATREKQLKTEPEKQKKQKQDTENQLRELRTYCRKNGWRIAGEYIDHSSGKRSDNRARFQQMMKDASQRKFDVVVVWALDRLSREGVHQTFEHIKTLKTYGCEFESFQEQHFRTTGPAGELMIAIAAWIAEQERIRISERTLAGLAEARRNGHVGGRRSKIVDRTRIKELHAQGWGVRRIAKAMAPSVDGGITHTTIARILKAA